MSTAQVAQEAETVRSLLQVISSQLQGNAPLHPVRN